VRVPALPQAEQTLAQYVRAHPTATNAIHELALLNVRLRDYKAAHRHLTRLIEIAPDFAPAYLNLAVLEHEHLQQRTEAAVHYQRFLELDPKTEYRDAVHQALARLAERESPPVGTPATPPPAVAVVTPAPSAPVAVSVEPPKPAPTIAPEKPVALPAPEPVKKMRPPLPTTPLPNGNRSRATTHYNRGVQHYQRKNIPEAIAAYQAAVEADPSFAAAYYNLAICHQASQQPERALEYYELALRANPDYADARFNYAILLHEQGYTDNAIAQYDRIVAANPNDAAAHLSLATLYAQNKATTGKARDHYTAYIRLAPNSPLARDIRRWLDQNR